MSRSIVARDSERSKQKADGRKIDCGFRIANCGMAGAEGGPGPVSSFEFRVKAKGRRQEAESRCQISDIRCHRSEVGRQETSLVHEAFPAGY
jgi:hypothetical protein